MEDGVDFEVFQRAQYGNNYQKNNDSQQVGAVFSFQKRSEKRVEPDEKNDDKNKRESAADAVCGTYSRNGKWNGEAQREVIQRVEQRLYQEVVHQFVSGDRKRLITLQVEDAQGLKQKPDKQCQDQRENQRAVKCMCRFELRDCFCQNFGQHKAHKYKNGQEINDRYSHKDIYNQVLVIPGCANAFEPVVFEECGVHIVGVSVGQ